MAGADQQPFTVDLLQSPQQELLESRSLLDLSGHLGMFLTLSFGLLSSRTGLGLQCCLGLPYLPQSSLPERQLLGQ